MCDALVQVPTIETLFRLHARYVGAIALRLLGRDADVDDVVQDVFLRAVRRLETLREPSAARAWLATMTVRFARRRLRTRRVRVFLGFDEVSARDVECLFAPDASPEHRALLARVYALLDEVPTDARVAWLLRHVEGEPLGRVADMCHCSLATAKRRIGAAERYLEEAMSDA